MLVELRGTEERTLEISGTIAPDALPQLDLALEIDGDRARVEVLFFRMRGLRMRGTPGPSFDYDEALWRVGVRFERDLAWLALACDLDSWSVRATGAVLVRYPVRRARFAIEHDSFAVTDENERSFGVRVTELDEVPTLRPPRRTLVRSNGALYEIPWKEDPTEDRHYATHVLDDEALVSATFGGAVKWDERSIVQRGRVHRCGIARRVR